MATKIPRSPALGPRVLANDTNIDRDVSEAVRTDMGEPQKQPEQRHQSSERGTHKSKETGLQCFEGGAHDCVAEICKTDVSGYPEQVENKEAAKGKTRPDGSDTPEELVRRETKTILIVKILAVGITIFASMLICGTVFGVAYESEKKAFEVEFESLSHSVLKSLVGDTFRHFWLCRTLGSAVNAMMDERINFLLVNNTNSTNETNDKDVQAELLRLLASPQTDFVAKTATWDALTTEARSVTGAVTLSWSPLLRTDDERRRFEAFATQQEQDQEASGQFPACYLCNNDPRQTVAQESRLALVEIPGETIAVPCVDMESAGLGGGLNERYCSLIQEYFSDACVCEVAAFNNAKGNSTQWSISSGLFRAVVGKTLEISELQTEEWSRPPYLPIWNNALLTANRKPLIFNQLSDPLMAEAFFSMLINEQGTISKTYLTPKDKSFNYLATVDRSTSNGSPFAAAFFPVRSPDGSRLMGAISFLLPWSNLLTSTVPKNGELVLVVIENSCQPDAMTFRVNPKGSNLQFEGIGNLHDKKYTRYSRASTYEEYDRLHAIIASNVGTKNNFTEADHCQYKFSVYPYVPLSLLCYPTREGTTSLVAQDHRLWLTVQQVSRRQPSAVVNHRLTRTIMINIRHHCELVKY
jgi:hypothetical protein